MRRFLIVFTILSILVMAQNVVAGTPVTLSPELLTAAVGEVAGLEFTAANAPVGGATPEPISLLLLVAGLSGLAAAGNRAEQRSRPARF